ncbi:MAG: hypothetical protein P8Y36_07960 [Alphaproteobacteria bacterium]
MSIRKFLLAIGLLFVLGGLALSVSWINQMNSRPSKVEKPKPKLPAVLVASHALPIGTLLRREDFSWREIPKSKEKRKRKGKQKHKREPGMLVRGKVSETTYFGAITRRGFAKGEAFTTHDLICLNRAIGTFCQRFSSRDIARWLSQLMRRKALRVCFCLETL